MSGGRSSNNRHPSRHEEFLLYSQSEKSETLHRGSGAEKFRVFPKFDGIQQQRTRRGSGTLSGNSEWNCQTGLLPFHAEFPGFLGRVPYRCHQSDPDPLEQWLEPIRRELAALTGENIGEDEFKKRWTDLASGAGFGDSDDFEQVLENVICAGIASGYEKNRKRLKK